MQVKIKLMTAAVALVTGASLIAGGFVLEIGKPSANPEAQAKNAVLVVRGYACHDAEKTTMTATAEGIVNGKRETIQLKPIALSGANTYALTREWPADGRWVITLVAANPNFNWQPSAIVKVDGGSIDFDGVTRLNRTPGKGDIEAALNTTAVASRF